ncbi:MAG: thiol-disulfide isomerase/thioredoxin [Limisphaerales bacterium]|jgi:thiol-disulfide isomerase/thioredoxin
MRQLICTFVLFLIAGAGSAQPAPTPEAAWQKVSEAMRPPTRPANTKGRLMTALEMQAFRALQAETSAHAADLAQQFTEDFPSHEKTAAARRQCQRLLNLAVRGGRHDRAEQLKKVEAEIYQKHNLTEEQRYSMRRAAVDRDAVVAQIKEGTAGMMEAYEKGVRGLQKDFPQHPENLQMLYAVALRATGTKAHQLAAEIARKSPSLDLRQSALALMRKVERVGQPFRIEFEDLNERKIDTGKMRGKVILIDFWATWCAPCLTEIPRLQALYAKYHDQGLEILGISADVDKQALEGMIEYKKIPWPQFFDEENRENRIKQALRVNDLPTQWLIDRKGRLHSTNARSNREETIKKLLAEDSDGR